MSRKKSKNISIDENDIIENIETEIINNDEPEPEIEIKKPKKPAGIKTLVQIIDGRIVAVCPNMDAGSKQFKHFKKNGFIEWDKK